MKSTDKHGRPWLKLKEAKAGMQIQVDAGFTCIKPYSIRKLHRIKNGLCFTCKEGTHLISGQADDGIYCVGLYKVPR